MSEQDTVNQIAQRLLERVLERITEGDLHHGPDLDVWDLVGHCDPVVQRALCVDALNSVRDEVHQHVDRMMASWLEDLDWKHKSRPSPNGSGAPVN